MAENNIDICIAARQQVGAVTYQQRPSSAQMDNLELENDDGYTSYQVTMPGADASGYAASVLQSIGNPAATLKMAQVTTTTMAGGMASVEVRIQDLRRRPQGDETEPPEPDPETEPTEEEEFEAGEGPKNAKIVNVEYTSVEAPLITLPELADLADAHPAIRDAMGMVARGANIYKPIPVDSSGTMQTPYDILGDEMCALIQSIKSYSVRVLNIVFSYKTRRNLNDKCQSQKIGEKISPTDLPQNRLGGKFGTRGNAFFMGRNSHYNSEDKSWTIEEKYILEIVPTLEEVKKRGNSDEDE